MNRRACGALAAAFLCLSSVAAAGQGVPCSFGFPDLAGTIVKQGDRYLVRVIQAANGDPNTAEARFLVKASGEAVYRIITDYAHYPDFMPGTTAAHFVQRVDAAQRWQFTLKVALFNVRYALDLTESRPDSSSWLLAWTYAGGDIKGTSGSWRVSECSNVTGSVLVQYTTRVDMGKIVPDWISDFLTSTSIPGLIDAIRKRAGEKAKAP